MSTAARSYLPSREFRGRCVNVLADFQRSLTGSIVFGTKDEMKKWADHRIADLKSRGFDTMPACPTVRASAAWKGVGKYAGLAVIGLTAVAGLLHHVLQGPNRVAEEDGETRTGSRTGVKA